MSWFSNRLLIIVTTWENVESLYRRVSNRSTSWVSISFSYLHHHLYRHPYNLGGNHWKAVIIDENQRGEVFDSVPLSMSEMLVRWINPGKAAMCMWCQFRIRAAGNSSISWNRLASLVTIFFCNCTLTTIFEAIIFVTWHACSVGTFFDLGMRSYRIFSAISSGMQPRIWTLPPRNSCIFRLFILIIRSICGCPRYIYVHFGWEMCNASKSMESPRSWFAWDWWW